MNGGHSMRVYSSKLTEEQIAEAIRLRNDDMLPWVTIAQRFSVDVKTVRRCCDPRFNRESYGVHEYLGAREANEEHRLRQYGDLLFKQRVLQIRREGASEAKHFRLGVITASGTAHARFSPARSLLGLGASALVDA